ncbi:hypothetical protein K469DRAFT_797027 [Zopfia rhizophila CBS 207.26]|uniref:Uncharacterized protein n=1 Tax=Zopfia rhizophila CBS 207.26 TaxID=1314779 RepID=A0A6A6DNW7_9PEZI|nr:hypothetical protein K469DRAFT_797027 [Zopfia rhizophila CBS 207.26]
MAMDKISKITPTSSAVSTSHWPPPRPSVFYTASRYIIFLTRQCLFALDATPDKWGRLATVGFPQLPSKLPKPNLPEMMVSAPVGYRSFYSSQFITAPHLAPEGFPSLAKYFRNWIAWSTFQLQPRSRVRERSYACGVSRVVRRAEPSSYPRGGTARRIHDGFDEMRRIALPDICAASGSEAGTVYSRFFDGEDDDERKDEVLAPLRRIIPEKKEDENLNSNADAGPEVAKAIVQCR